MAFLQNKTSLLFILGTLATLAACSGMSPGGNAPGEIGGLGTVGNSLDGGGELGLGGPLADGGSGGQAVPSTQQSTDSIGGGCAIKFKVKVKVLRNGSEQFCTASSARIHPDYTIPEDGVLAQSDDYSTPRATLDLTFQGSSASPITLSKSQNAVCVGGIWETPDPFFFRYLCSAGDNYQVRTRAAWMPTGGRLATSRTYEGSPQREEGNYDPIPIEVTIDLGYDLNPHYELPEEAVNVLN